MKRCCVVGGHTQSYEARRRCEKYEHTDLDLQSRAMGSGIGPLGALKLYRAWNEPLTHAERDDHRLSGPVALRKSQDVAEQVRG